MGEIQWGYGAHRDAVSERVGAVHEREHEVAVFADRCLDGLDRGTDAPRDLPIDGNDHRADVQPRSLGL